MLQSADTMGCNREVKGTLSRPEIIRIIWGGNIYFRYCPSLNIVWKIYAMLVNTAIYPSHQAPQRGEYSSGGQSPLRSYGCSIQSNERVSRSANCMPSERWATQRRMGSVRIREERHGNETPHAYIVAKYDKLESWRKTQIWWWRHMTKNISAKTKNL